MHVQVWLLHIFILLDFLLSSSIDPATHCWKDIAPIPSSLPPFHILNLSITGDPFSLDPSVGGQNRISSGLHDFCPYLLIPSGESYAFHLLQLSQVVPAPTLPSMESFCTTFWGFASLQSSSLMGKSHKSC